MKSPLPSCWTILLSSWFLVGPGPSAQGEMIRVSPDGDGTDGLSWTTAYTNITDALTASASGDHIWIKSATYQEALELKTGVSIFGGFCGTEADNDFYLRDYEKNTTTVHGGGLSQPIIQVRNVDQVLIDGIVVTGGESQDGGGVVCLNAELHLRHCTIADNRSLRVGGGIDSSSSAVHVESCILADNTAETDGGGISSVADELIIERTVLHGNWARQFGGGVRVVGGTVEATNSVFGRNCAFFDGGGILCANDAVVDLNSCTLAGNSAGIEAEGWGVFCANFTGVIDDVPQVMMTNSIVAEQRTPLGGEEISIIYSDVAGIDVEGEGNINVDPQFVGGSPFDYHLRANSPCIDSGTKVDLSADLDGNPRPVDVPDVGHGGEFAFDMGAYEWQLPRADLDRNGKVDAKDLMMFQGEWTTHAGGR